MDVVNLSAEPLGKLFSWLPLDLHAERVVFLPDACPGKSPLPTGTAVFTKQSDWRRFAVSDCGCGMRLIKSKLSPEDLNVDLWDSIAKAVKRNKGRLGDLGGGNHFLDALLPFDEDVLYFLIHTGSRQESGIVDDLVDKPGEFEREFDRVVDWAESNRAAIQSTIENQIGATEMLLDLPHNTFERLEEGVVIRKGSVKLKSGEMTILPSHMSGDASLVVATERASEILFSMSHGTGRIMSRGDAKIAARGYKFDELRRQVILPTFLNPASLTTEGPYAYRDLDDCLALVDGHIEEVKRYSVVAYMGHL